MSPLQRLSRLRKFALYVGYIRPPPSKWRETTSAAERSLGRSGLDRHAFSGELFNKIPSLEVVELKRGGRENIPGWEEESFSRQMKESEGNDVSVWEPKRLRGSVPVEENSETSPGWTEEENMAAWVKNLKKFEQLSAVMSVSSRSSTRPVPRGPVTKVQLSTDPCTETSILLNIVTRPVIRPHK